MLALLLSQGSNVMGKMKSWCQAWPWSNRDHHGWINDQAHHTDQHTSLTPDTPAQGFTLNPATPSRARAELLPRADSQDQPFQSLYKAQAEP